MVRNNFMFKKLNAFVLINEADGYWNGKINGKIADDGVYFYKYEVTGLDGSKVTGQGSVELIR